MSATSVRKTLKIVILHKLSLEGDFGYPFYLELIASKGKAPDNLLPFPGTACLSGDTLRRMLELTDRPA
jgi:hypothetical protein